MFSKTGSISELIKVGGGGECSRLKKRPLGADRSPRLPPCRVPNETGGKGESSCSDWREYSGEEQPLEGGAWGETPGKDKLSGL